MATYKSPGVYVEEISTLPPSVAEVSTAVPAFVGYTQLGAGSVHQVSTMLEFEQAFGLAAPSTFTVETHVDPATGDIVTDSITRGESGVTPKFLMHYCLDLYFKNGGSRCYVASVGDFGSTPAKEHFERGLAMIEQEDEPTLLVLTDAVNLAAGDYYDLCQQALAQCKKLGDRFAVFDVKDGDVDAFRNGIGTDGLAYGAAYYPYLATNLGYRYREQDVTVIDKSAAPSAPSWQKTFGADGITVSQTGSPADTPPQVQITKGTAATAVGFTVEDGKLTISNADGKTGADVATAFQTWMSDPGNDAGGFTITASGTGDGPVTTTGASVEDLQSTGGGGSGSSTLASVQSTKTALYNHVKKALSKPRAVLPASAAVAGIYARVDRDRGVWKAPANVSVSSIIGPETRITNDDQERLNVDPTAGKSINAIRAFAGKGTLVWGARTLAGNDNEWRYVSVRRLFIMIEESAKKSTAFAVFEPNDATTWLKVKGMLESYLYGLWERGALQGSTPEQAYFVNVGLGKTMTVQDVLEGRMIVEIGIAAVRPAEFIVLRFTHKLPEA